MGWRETVRMNPGEITRVAMQFKLPTGTAPPNSKRLLASYGINGAEYVWHCHILEHEEHDMMRPMVVIKAPPAATAHATSPKK
jgi:spore coat protein A